MDQDIEIINTNTRLEKFKNFLTNNKKSIIALFISAILILFGYFFYIDFKKKQKIQLSNIYNLAVIKFENGEKNTIVKDLIYIIEEKDKTYSPLSLYFLIDNKLINSNEEANKYFDLLINDVDLDNEIRDLVIYKKGLFNSDFESEDKMLNILKPLINSKSVWKSHALYLIAEYFFSKGEKQKSREFFDKILSLETSNSKIKLEAQKRIRRDFSE